MRATTWRRVAGLLTLLGSTAWTLGPGESAAQPNPPAPDAAPDAPASEASVAEGSDADAAAVRSPHLPADAVLERRGAVIGEIRIRAGDIFDLTREAENRALYRLANRLHRSTRSEVIEQQLLFRTGDPYSRRLLDESERILRSKRYLYDAHIEPVRYHGNRVDVEVATRDVWTLRGAASLGRSGGENNWRFEIQDVSFLGTGKDLTLRQLRSVDRTGTMLRYRDPNLLGTRGRLEVEYSDNSDGQNRIVDAERPFYSLDTRWAAGLRASSRERIDPLYARGEITDRIGHRQTFCELSGGRSRGRVAGRVRRFRAGMTYLRDEFAVAEGYAPPYALPEDRLLVYPWIELESIDDAFLESMDLDQIHRTEDRHVGLRFRARLGFSSPAWGGDRNRFIFSTDLTDTFAPGPDQMLELSAAGAGRWGSEGAENVRVGARGRYYWRNFGKHLFFASLSVDYADQLDGERQLLLGGDSGLRGYPLRYQDGDRRYLLTLEQRFFTDWHLFELFHVGAAVFLDVGRAWFDGAPSGIDTGMLKDVGFGLRIGQSRSGRGTLTHLDIAFPLDGDDSIRRVQFLIATSDSF
ncbi:MAG: hypothetical protein GY856_06710 [bacterium]|nr:hypothetical protein [bacterium]